MAELLPEGNYTAITTPVVDSDGRSCLVQFGFAGENSTRQVLVYFEILEGPHTGVIVPWFGYFTKKTYERTLQSLRYCGMRGSDLSTLNEQDLDQVVQIAVEHNEYNDRIMPRVAWVNRLGSGTVKLNNPMSKSDLRAFAAQMRAHLDNEPEVQSATAPRERGVARTPGNNGTASQGRVQDPWPTSASDLPPTDDIPF